MDTSWDDDFDALDEIESYEHELGNFNLIIGSSYQQNLKPLFFQQHPLQFQLQIPVYKFLTKILPKYFNTTHHLPFCV